MKKVKKLFNACLSFGSKNTNVKGYVYTKFTERGTLISAIGPLPESFFLVELYHILALKLPSSEFKRSYPGRKTIYRSRHSQKT